MTDYTPDEQKQLEEEAARAALMSILEPAEPMEIPEYVNAPVPEIDADQLALMQSQHESMDEEYDPFIFDTESLNTTDVKPMEDDESTDKVLEDWEQKLLAAREIQMSKIGAGSFIINGLIQGNEPGIMFGASGSKKTFVAVHMACCIAAGKPCFGKGVRRGMVHYFSPEDPAGVRERVRGWEQRYNNGQPLPMMHVHPFALNLLDGETMEAFKEQIRLAYAHMPKEFRKTSLIVVDTLSANNASLRNDGKPLDENSNNDMALMLAKASELARFLKCAILFIHHSGKESADKKPGAKAHSRGASALNANIGFEIHLAPLKGQLGVCIEPTKLKMSATLPKMKVDFHVSKLPPELLEERKRAVAELCPDSEGSVWNSQVYDTTLVAKNDLLPMNTADMPEGESDPKPAKERKITHAERIALFVRGHSSLRGVPIDVLAQYFAKSIGNRTLVKREAQRAVEKGFLYLTATGAYKHNQGATDALQEEYPQVTTTWTPDQAEEFPGKAIDG